MIQIIQHLLLIGFPPGTEDVMWISSKGVVPHLYAIGRKPKPLRALSSSLFKKWNHHNPSCFSLVFQCVVLKSMFTAKLNYFKLRWGRNSRGFYKFYSNMSVFLCVYNKSGGLNQRLTPGKRSMVFDSLGGKRALCKLKFGFHAELPERFAGGFLENNDDVTFVAVASKFCRRLPTSITSPEINSDSFHGAFAALFKNSAWKPLLTTNTALFPLFVYENNDLIALCSEYQYCAFCPEKKETCFWTDAIADNYCLGTTATNKTNNIYSYLRQKLCQW